MNRDYVLKQMSEALQTIYGAAQATGKSEPSPLEAPGALSGALDNFDVSNKKDILYVNAIQSELNFERDFLV